MATRPRRLVLFRCMAGMHKPKSAATIMNSLARWGTNRYRRSRRVSSIAPRRKKKPRRAAQVDGRYWGSADAHYHFSDGPSRPVKATSTTVSLLTTPKLLPRSRASKALSVCKVAGHAGAMPRANLTMQEKVNLNHFIAGLAMRHAHEEVTQPPALAG